MPEAEKIDPATPHITQEHMQKLAELFPSVVQEGQVNFNALRALLGEAVSTQDAYRFTWAGKQEAYQALQEPSLGTLTPAPEESVNWDSTQNLFIEGENLEVLKLLYKSYWGQVKMIYIDPPYNTGNDFVYKDDYSEPLRAYLAKTGQLDAEGNQLYSNGESSGRYHSNWLNMMYPRLMLARQLLRQDGVIFVSIDDREVHHLRLLMNEIFGEVNYLGTIVWRKKTNGNNMGYVPPVHDYFLVYAKDALEDTLLGFPLSEEYLERTYSNPDSDPRGPWTTSDLSANHRGPHFPITNPDTGTVHYPPEGRYWVFSEKEVKKRIKQGRIIFGKTGEAGPVQKVFLGERSSLRVKAESWWGEHGFNADGTKELAELLAPKIFDHSKPSITLEHLVNISTINDDLIMDFFAGSGTMAQAVLQMNRKDHQNRRFIIVQIPELTAKDSIAKENGFDNVADLAKERIRRVIAQLQPQAGELDYAYPEDLGFRVFKLAPSTLYQWPKITDLEQLQAQLKLPLSGTVPEASLQAVRYELLLKQGLTLDASFTPLPAITSNQIERVTDGRLLFYLCLDETISPHTRDQIEAHIPELNEHSPIPFVARDDAFTDESKINLSLYCRVKTF